MPTQLFGVYPFIAVSYTHQAPTLYSGTTNRERREMTEKTSEGPLAGSLRQGRLQGDPDYSRVMSAESHP